MKNSFKPIKKVLIAGRGSVGITEGLILNDALNEDRTNDDQSAKVNFAFVADPERINRYRNEPLIVDGKPVFFPYVSKEEEFERQI